MNEKLIESQAFILIPPYVELIYYCVFLALAVFFLYRLSFRYALILASVFAVIVRLGFPEIDFMEYWIKMRIDVINLYYMKEPVYWLISRYIFKLTGSQVITFLVYDFMAVFLFFTAFRDKAEAGLVVLMFLAFPMILGIENVFRQYLGTVFMVYSASLLYNKKWVAGSVVFIISVLTHNFFILFAPIFALILIPWFSIRTKLLLLLAGEVGFYFLFLVVTSIKGMGKSSTSTGLQLDLVYFLVLFISGCVLYYLSGDENKKRGDILLYVIYAISTMFVIYLYKGFGIAVERSGMVFLQLLFAVFILNLSYKRLEGNQKRFFQLLLFGALNLPVLLFPATRGMLLH